MSYLCIRDIKGDEGQAGECNQGKMAHTSENSSSNFSCHTSEIKQVSEFDPATSFLIQTEKYKDNGLS